MNATPAPPGYLSKIEAAQRIGFSTKTLDRRIKSEPLLSEVLRKGRQVFLPIAAVEAYFEMCQKRGHL